MLRLLHHIFFLLWIVIIVLNFFAATVLASSYSSSSSSTGAECEIEETEESISETLAREHSHIASSTYNYAGALVIGLLIAATWIYHKSVAPAVTLVEDIVRSTRNAILYQNQGGDNNDGEEEEEEMKEIRKDDAKNKKKNKKQNKGILESVREARRELRKIDSAESRLVARSCDHILYSLSRYLSFVPDPLKDCRLSSHGCFPATSFSPSSSSSSASASSLLSPSGAAGEQQKLPSRMTVMCISFDVPIHALASFYASQEPDLMNQLQELEKKIEKQKEKDQREQQEQQQQLLLEESKRLSEANDNNDNTLVFNNTATEGHHHHQKKKEEKSGNNTPIVDSLAASQHQQRKNSNSNSADSGNKQKSSDEEEKKNNLAVPSANPHHSNSQNNNKKLSRQGSSFMSSPGDGDFFRSPADEASLFAAAAAAAAAGGGGGAGQGATEEEGEEMKQLPQQAEGELKLEKDGGDNIFLLLPEALQNSSPSGTQVTPSTLPTLSSHTQAVPPPPPVTQEDMDALVPIPLQFFYELLISAIRTTAKSHGGYLDTFVGDYVFVNFEETPHASCFADSSSSSPSPNPNPTPTPEGEEEEVDSPVLLGKSKKRGRQEDEEEKTKKNKKENEDNKNLTKKEIQEQQQKKVMSEMKDKSAVRAAECALTLQRRLRGIPSPAGSIFIGLATRTAVSVVCGGRRSTVQSQRSVTIGNSVTSKAATLTRLGQHLLTQASQQKNQQQQQHRNHYSLSYDHHRFFLPRFETTPGANHWNLNVFVFSDWSPERQLYPADSSSSRFHSPASSPASSPQEASFSHSRREQEQEQDGEEDIVAAAAAAHHHHQVKESITEKRLIIRGCRERLLGRIATPNSQNTSGAFGTTNTMDDHEHFLCSQFILRYLESQNNNNNIFASAPGSGSDGSGDYLLSDGLSRDSSFNNNPSSPASSCAVAKTTLTPSAMSTEQYQLLKLPTLLEASENKTPGENNSDTTNHHPFTPDHNDNNNNNNNNHNNNPVSSPVSSTHTVAGGDDGSFSSSILLFSTSVPTGEVSSVRDRVDAKFQLEITLDLLDARRTDREEKLSGIKLLQQQLRERQEEGEREKKKRQRKESMRRLVHITDSSSSDEDEKRKSKKRNNKKKKKEQEEKEKEKKDDQEPSNNNNRRHRRRRQSFVAKQLLHQRLPRLINNPSSTSSNANLAASVTSHSTAAGATAIAMGTSNTPSSSSSMTTTSFEAWIKTVNIRNEILNAVALTQPTPAVARMQLMNIPSSDTKSDNNNNTNDASAAASAAAGGGGGGIEITTLPDEEDIDADHFRNLLEKHKNLFNASELEELNVAITNVQLPLFHV